MKKSNRKLRKVMLLACCALALVAISVGATLAYLTDTEAVTNVFTVGKVGISLDEADTDNSTPNKDRDTENKYHLIPGQTYDKDPTVHVDADSEPSWLFVKVENGLAPILAEAEYINKSGGSATGNIEDQMKAFGWNELTGVEGVDNVWYQKHETKSAQEVDYVVFKTFKVGGDATNVPMTTEDGEGGTIITNETYLPQYEDAKIKVTAYAIQMAGFENNAAGAWAAGKFN